MRRRHSVRRQQSDRQQQSPVRFQQGGRQQQSSRQQGDVRFQRTGSPRQQNSGQGSGGRQRRQTGGSPQLCCNTKNRPAERRGAGKKFANFLIILVVLMIIVGLCIAAANKSDGSSTSDGDNTSGASSSDDTGWELTLVNKWHKIPRGYDVELTELSNGQSVDSRIYPSLQKMFDAARADGVYPVVAAGYRTADEQQQMMDEKVAELQEDGYTKKAAKEEAKNWVAVKGYSEHQLGLAVDINADGVHSKGTEVYSWLAKNAYQYGFILRYPEDKESITGTEYEPWHYRYVGVSAAADMKESGQCLEEYLGEVEED